ncbi:MAG: DUF2142 domain-containing protein [Planctomycetota bacterium]|jgi:predicted membrane channel-forming protein YqfA (hemolysin III family)
MRHTTLWIAVAGYLLLSIGYTVSTPAFESPDESDHYRYASYLAHAGRMPYIPGTAVEHDAIEGLDEEHLAHHPPLYYLVLATAMHAGGHGDTTFSLRQNPDFNQPGRESRYLAWLHGHDERGDTSDELALLHLLRGLSVLCGLGTLLCTWRLGIVAFPKRPGVAGLAALLMASLPMWSFMHGALDNGNLATLLSHAALLVTCAVVVHGRLAWGHGVVLGLLTGLALVTKLNSLFLLPLLAAAWGWSLWRCPTFRWRTLGAGVVALVLIVAVAGWFFLRNQQLYGDLLAEAAHAKAYAAAAMPAHLAGQWLLGDFVPALFGSLLGKLGWMVLPMPGWLTWVALLLLLVGVAGLIVACARREARPDLVVVVFLALACLLVFLLTARFNMKFGQPQGRYLFPALGPAMLLLALGLHRLGATTFLARVPHLLWQSLALVPPVLGLLILLFWFRPAFDPELTDTSDHRAALVHGITQPPASPTIELLGPADGVRLDAPPTLRWQPAAPDGAAPDTDAIYTVHAFTAEGRILFCTHEWFHLEIHGGEWEIPAPGWQLLPRDVEIGWKVRRVPNRAQGESVWEMPGSGVRRFVRQAR